MTKLVTVGEISGAYGVKGWVKIRSHTDPADNILSYAPWFIGSGETVKEVNVLNGRAHGGSVVAQLEGVDDRDAAFALQRALISVDRSCFPRLGSNEFYWADLLGLRVYTTEQVDLGRVTGLLETGAHDVLEVRGDRERLIPFVMGDFVKEVRLEQGEMTVDWDPDF